MFPELHAAAHVHGMTSRIGRGKLGQKWPDGHDVSVSTLNGGVSATEPAAQLWLMMHGRDGALPPAHQKPTGHMTPLARLDKAGQ
jgi:hypothetical protein